MIQKLLFFAGIVAATYVITVTGSGCAQVGMPTGGPRDTLAPVLSRSVPVARDVNFKGNKIVLTFDEYVEVQDVQTNVLVSPVQKNNPDIRSLLRTVTVKLRDTLRPNTTYSINFGNSIKDVNEGNVFKNYTYIFSTGNQIDSQSLSGRVVMAETGQVDTTLNVLLYRDANDSSVLKTRPDYMARVNADGSFKFEYLPAASFNIYALKDGDGGKFYNSKAEAFAFRPDNKKVNTGDTATNITLYAYVQEKPKSQVTTTPAKSTGISTPKNKTDKRLRYQSNLGQPPSQDLYAPLEVTFTNTLKTFDEQKTYLADTNYTRLSNVKVSFDSTRRVVKFHPAKWQPESKYILLIDKSGIEDSLNTSLSRNDTLRFSTKKVEDYGKLLLRFAGLDLGLHPVLQVLQNDDIKASFPITANEWSNSTFAPGEYVLRILYDANNNGTWDPGNYSKNLQPEKVVAIPQKLTLRANWDNERDIKL
jgi:hypothetical protein